MSTPPDDASESPTSSRSDDNWHKNQHLFDEEKESYFSCPYSSDPRYRSRKGDFFHWPHLDYVDCDCDRDGEYFVVMGWCTEKHTLREGDEIVVHGGSGFALMHDHRRWSRELLTSEQNKPGVVYICRVMNIMSHDDDEFSHCVECLCPSSCPCPCTCPIPRHSCLMYTIYPGDVVINVRYRRQRNAASVIQRAWRFWVVRRKKAVLRIEDAVSAWMHRVDGPVYNRAKADFERLAIQSTRQ